MKIILGVAFATLFLGLCLGLCLGLFVPIRALGYIRRIRRRRRLRSFASGHALLAENDLEDNSTRLENGHSLFTGHTVSVEHKDIDGLLRIREEQWRYIKQMVERSEARDVDDIVQEIQRTVEGHVTNKVLDDIKKIHQHRKQTSPVDGDGIRRLISMLESPHCLTARNNYENDKNLEEAVDTIVHIICERLTSFSGELISVGSTHDGTRVSACADFDFLFELVSAPGVQDCASGIELYTLKDGHLRLVLCNDIIKPLQLYKSFAEEIGKICDNLQDGDFPPGLKFGGFAEPAFSGVRFNEPAVTLLFKWTDFQSATQVISADITLAMKIPKDAEPMLTLNIATQLSAFCHVSTEIVCDKCHLVPVWPYGDQWFLTTAVLDKWIFEKLGPENRVTATIKECKQRAKFVSDAIEQTYEKRYPETTEPIKPQQDFLATRLAEYSQYLKQGSYPDKVEALRSSLSEFIAVGHIFFSAKTAEQHSEISSKLVSFNSAAFKYKTLSLVLDDKDVSVNTSMVLKNLGTGRVEHTFLRSFVRLVALGYGSIINSAAFDRVVKGTRGFETKGSTSFVDASIDNPTCFQYKIDSIN